METATALESVWAAAAGVLTHVPWETPSILAIFIDGARMPKAKGNITCWDPKRPPQSKK